MNEPEYLQTPLLRLHRWASLGLVVASVLRYAAVYGSGFSIRRHADLVLPLALIWYADDLATKAIEASGGWLSVHYADAVLRVCGWILFLLLLLARNIDMLR